MLVMNTACRGKQQPPPIECSYLIDGGGQKLPSRVTFTLYGINGDLIYLSITIVDFKETTNPLNVVQLNIVAQT